MRRAGRSGAPIVVESVGPFLPSAGNFQVVVLGVRVGDDCVHPAADRSREVCDFGLERTYRRSDLRGGGTNLRLRLLGRRTQAGKLRLHSFGRGLDRIGCCLHAGLEAIGLRADHDARFHIGHRALDTKSAWERSVSLATRASVGRHQRFAPQFCEVEHYGPQTGM